MSLSFITIDTHAKAKTVVIFLHGLGASGHDLVPLVSQLPLLQRLAIRVILPHAPQRALTLNGGMIMPAWYDIFGTQEQARQDEAGIKQAMQWLKELIEKQHQEGIAYDKILLAGFSQGGALALATALCYPKRLAGTIALSTYLPIANKLLTMLSKANRDMPIFIAHGTQDQVLKLAFGKFCYQQLLQYHYPVQWHQYPMAHTICDQELADMSDWLQKILCVKR